MRHIQKIIYSLVLLLLSHQTHASLILKGTRIIYPGDKERISIQTVNDSEQASLIQSWIDEGDIHSTPETTKAPFIVTPPVAKIAANEGAQLHIQYIGEDLPQDRESVFYLNVLDISPKPQNKQGMNLIQLALQIRIKLFYRPTILSGNIESVIDLVKLSSSDKQLIIENPTPYFLNISEVYYEKNQQNPIAKSVMVAPFSEQNIHENNEYKQDIVVVFINDQGNLISHKIKRASL
ncbi:MAG: fimbrial biogenesis chaperone [Providencia rustigianii]|uniref:fimbrial biogenesis chaperone n=1 Tax=Providencia rustigianii TaxID=158850 RepID=UPI003F378023